MADPIILTLHELKRPDAPMAFTLDGDQFWMDISAILTPLSAAQKGPTEPWLQELEAAGLKLAGGLVQSFSGPVHVRDMSINVVGDTVTLQIWLRRSGLRVAPIMIVMDGIDDPEAAADFAQQVAEKAAEAAHPGRYKGPLDYWGTWIAGILSVLSGFIALGWWLSRRSRNS